MEHTFSLQKYAGPSTRHTCPQCGSKRSFTLYIDETGEPLAGHVGRCDHESSCGYHYTPAQFFSDNPHLSSRHPELDSGSPRDAFSRRFLSNAITIKQQPLKQKPLCTIPSEIVAKTLNTSIPSSFTLFLTSLLGPEKTAELATIYGLGVTKSRDVIFYQIDIKGRYRTGKIMKYNPQTGKRIKDEKIQGRITWVHSLMKQTGQIPSDWELTQCLFGEHLLPKNPGKKVALVESEKTAIICSAVMPDYIWLATGGKSQLNSRLEVLRGRQIIAFPDIDGYQEWTAKLSELKHLNITISDYLESIATDKLREAHIDLADIIVEELRTGPVPLSHSAGAGTQRTDWDSLNAFHNPNFLQVLPYLSEAAIGPVAHLMADFDLVPVDVWQSSPDCPNRPNCP